MAKTDIVKYEEEIRRLVASDDPEDGAALDMLLSVSAPRLADVLAAVREYAGIPDGVTLLAGPETQRAMAEITVRKFAATRKLRAALAALDQEAQR